MLAWLEKQGELVNSLSKGLDNAHERIDTLIQKNNSLIEQLEKRQGEKTNPYSGISFEYNGHVWGMCARDNGVDILLDKQLFKHLEKQDEQKETLCDKCRREQPSHFCQDITELGRCALEHQSNQKQPTDKVEPKLEIEKDKWYICIRDLYDNYGTRAFRKGNTYYSTKDETLMPDNSNIPVEIKYCVNDYFHLWTIQDANVGDVLEFDDHERHVVGIVSYVNKTTGKVDVNCLLENNNFKVGIYYNLDTIKPHPATKEQRDLLFQKMKEVGYEWDVEKKGLKKIEQKPSWSEEDEKKRNGLIKGLEDRMGFGWASDPFSREEYIDWLKSLKPQNTWKPSDEQIKALGIAIRCGIQLGTWEEEALESLKEQLKKLKEG
jgi:hypothetical protein